MPESSVAHAGTSEGGGEACQGRLAPRRASARETTLRMTATRATLGCLPRSRRRVRDFGTLGPDERREKRGQGVD